MSVMGRPKLCILVLEDDQLLQKSWRRVLEKRGHDVIMAGTVEEFRTLLHSPPCEVKKHPDVLLLDRQVHCNDGWALRKEAPPGVRVVLMTGQPPPDAPPHYLKALMPINVLVSMVEG